MPERSEKKLWNLIPRTVGDFCYVLVGLMPRGFAWFTGLGSNWRKLFTGLSCGFKAVYDMLIQLVKEMSPVSTTELSVWENELGLPKKGLEFVDAVDRKKEILRVSRDECGCSVNYIKSVAALFGLNVDVYEYWKNPEMFVGVDFGGMDPNFFVVVKSDELCRDVDYHYCDGYCDDRLLDFGNSNYEAVVLDLSPAHVKILFEYEVEAA